MSAAHARQPLLVELGTEELPPLALPELERAFAAGVRTGLTDAGLPFGELRSFATPRRAQDRGARATARVARSRPRLS